MQYIFYFFSLLSIISTFLVIIQKNAIYALFYLIISFLSVSGVFFSIGAFFAGALEVIIYAGAIVVLFVFVIMMLNLKDNKKYKKDAFFQSFSWKKPVFLLSILFFLMTYSIFFLKEKKIHALLIDSKIVGINLFGPYVLLVELSSILLFSALVVVFHIGKKRKSTKKNN